METSLEQVLQVAASRLQALTKLPLASICGVERQDEGWHVQVELVEKESIPHGMDILGLYDAWLSPTGALQRFSRRSTRRRSDVSGDI